MKRSVGFLSVVVLLLATAGTARGQFTSDMVNTPHDLVNGGGNTYITLTTTPANDLCQVCHVPHGGTTEAPLWNRTLSEASYSTYTSATIDGTVANPPSGVSAACLSCHDGSVALDAFGGATGTAGNELGGTAGGASPADLGTDLRNDHPISITYDVTDTDLRAVADVDTTAVVLYGTATRTVECGSCHNPHEWTAVTPDSAYVRVTRAGSEMCLKCHAK